MEEYNSIEITYKLLNFGTNCEFNELFIPFTAEELNIFYTKKGQSPLFLNNIKINLFDFFSSEIVKTNEISRDESQISNILLDILYCITKAIPFSYIDILIHQDLYFYELSEIISYNGVDYYIGIYTELLKNEINDLKLDLSFLLNSYYQGDYNPRINYYLSNIRKKYNIPFNVSFKYKESIKDSISYLVHYNNFSSSKEKFFIEIDLRKFDKFISLLRKYRQPRVNFVENHNCFCLMKYQGEFFFSLSGYKYNNSNLANKIKIDLGSYFKNIRFTFCDRTDIMLSYGYKYNNGFKRYQNPDCISYKDALIKFPNNKDELTYQFSCCERKIFPYIKGSSDIYIYCKYKPCEKCLPAVSFEKSKHKKFIFFAFFDDSKSFFKYMKKHKKIILKNYDSKIVTSIY